MVVHTNHHVNHTPLFLVPFRWLIYPRRGGGAHPRTTAPPMLGNLLSKKNLLVFLLATCFALYQFNKQRGALSGRGSPTGQLAQAKRLAAARLDLWTHDLVLGKNNREDEVLLVLRRPPQDAPAGSTAAAPAVLAEIVADPRVYKANRRRARSRGGRRDAERRRKTRRWERENRGRPRGGPGDPGGRRHKRGRRHGSGRRRKGGVAPWRSGSGGRGGRGGGHNPLDDLYNDGLPALRMSVFDPTMAPLQELLQHRGFVEGEVGKGPPSGGQRDMINQPVPVTGSPAAGSAAAAAAAAAATAKAKATPMSDADIAREAEKRQRKQEAKAAEEATKRREEGKKQSEEARKEVKRRAAAGGQALEEENEEGGRSVAVDADGTAAEL